MNRLMYVVQFAPDDGETLEELRITANDYMVCRVRNLYSNKVIDFNTGSLSGIDLILELGERLRKFHDNQSLKLLGE